MVRQYEIRRKSNLGRLGSLMIECLIDGAYAAIREQFSSLGSRAR